MLIRNVLTCGLVASTHLGCELPGPNDRRPLGSATTASSGSSSASAHSTAPPTGSSNAAPALGGPTPEAYAGPTGTLHGVIHIKGDAAPATPHVYPKGCGGEAAAMYGKLFRVGQDGTLADAIVSVTNYKGFVPQKKAAIEVSVQRCSYSTRSIAMTDGQHIAVRNLDLDTTSYLPWLDGAKLPAGIVATPQGDAVKLYSRGYGRYWLRDQMARTFMVAHVFHFRYSTTAVTRLDGAYRIEGLPVGPVDVSVMLPQAKLLSVTKPFEVKAGTENQLDLELTFDSKRDVPDPSEDTLSESGNALRTPAPPGD